MDVPQWTPGLSVGHDVLDQHHRALFGLLAELSAGIEQGPDENWARGIGDRLLAYVDYHFREEEALLEAAEYPFLTFHRASHQVIALRMQAVLQGLGRRPLAEVLAELQDFVADWLTHHIEIEDFEYRAFLAPVG